jgi:hypothetical protein
MTTAIYDPRFYGKLVSKFDELHSQLTADISKRGHKYAERRLMKEAIAFDKKKETKRGP